MAKKLRNLQFPASLTEGGWFIPTDYPVMRQSFRRELVRMYMERVPDNARILDLNPGIDGLGQELLAAGHGYTALYQNPLIRDLLVSQAISVRDWRPPSIPHSNECFDLVLSLGFLEHMPTWIHAVELLLEIRRVLRAQGRVLLICPHASGMGASFWMDYKQGWIVSKKRLTDMAGDVGLEVISTRYSIGWITLMGGPFGALSRTLARSVNGLLNLSLVARPLETLGLQNMATKVQKTICELIAIELRKPNRRNADKAA